VIEEQKVELAVYPDFVNDKLHVLGEVEVGDLKQQWIAEERVATRTVQLCTTHNTRPAAFTLTCSLRAFNHLTSSIIFVIIITIITKYVHCEEITCTV